MILELSKTCILFKLNDSGENTPVTNSESELTGREKGYKPLPGRLWP